MDQVDRDRIERFATEKVRYALNMTRYLVPDIKEGDKMPSWDGTVLIYNSIDKKKENIVGKVDLQIKGHMVEPDLLGNPVTNELASIADLNNYLKTGGAIYFVVNINREDLEDRKIYYETLTPLKISRYLESGKGKKKRQVLLREFPADNPYEIETIFYNFNQDCSKQHSFKNIPPLKLAGLTSRNDIKGISCSVTSFLPNARDLSPIQVFLNSEIYLYAELKGSSIMHPIEFTSGQLSFIHKPDVKIYLNGEVYENYIQIQHNKNDFIIRLGESMTITILQNSSRCDYTYTPSRNLQTRIKDFKFFIDAIENNRIDFEDGRFLNLDTATYILNLTLYRQKQSLLVIRRYKLFSISFM